MSNQAPWIRMVLFRIRRKADGSKKTPGAEALGVLVREAGLEPARPEWTLEPESSESANSTTRAYLIFKKMVRMAGLEPARPYEH